MFLDFPFKYSNLKIIFIFRYKHQELCNYSNPRNGEPYFCSKPPSGKCSKIVMIKTWYDFPSKGSHNLNKPFDIIPQLKPKFHKDSKIIGSGSLLQVRSAHNTNELVKDTSLYKTSINSFLRPNGYSYNGHWVSLTHAYKTKPLNEFVKCFTHKVVYILGDSTMRQFFNLLVEPLSLNLSTSHYLPSPYHHVLRAGRNQRTNTSVYYRCHGLPIRLAGPPSLSVYMTDLINGIETGGSNVIIIISIGIHYLEYHPAFFIHRLVGIKRALLCHISRFPETKIIVKGLNVSNNKQFPFEWLVYRYNVLLKEIFKDVKSVKFVDLWDMTTAWPLEDYHPRNNVLFEQANLMFSTFCS